MTLVTIIIYLLILSILVIAHEFGHFSVAKFFHVRVDEFGLGFPPLICKLFRWKGTDFILNWIPLGGYVNLAGENAPAGAADERELKASDDTKGQDLFYNKPAWQRFLVILAGPLVNLLLAAAVFMLAYGVWGIPREVPGQVYIAYVESDSPAELAGIKEGDRLYRLTDSSASSVLVETSDQAMDFFAAHHGETITLELMGDCHAGVCDGEVATYTATLRHDDNILPSGGAIGLGFSSYQDFFYPWYQQIPLSIYYGFRQSFYMTVTMLRGLWTAIKQLFTSGKSEVIVMGPVGIVTELNRQETFRAGLMAIISFAGILSLNLGVINLLPIPAVDGGRLFLIICEKIVGRKCVACIEGWLNYLGFIIVILLMLLVTGADIMRLFTGG